MTQQETGSRRRVAKVRATSSSPAPCGYSDVVAVYSWSATLTGALLVVVVPSPSWPLELKPRLEGERAQ